MTARTAPANTSDRRAEKDRFLSEFALALAEGVQLPGFLQQSVKRLGEILGVDRVALFFFEGPSGTGDLLVSASFVAPGVAPLPRNVSGPWKLLLERLAQLQPLSSEDVLGEPALAPYHETFRSIGTKSLLAVPIHVDGTPRGVVGAATVRASRKWTPDDVAFLESAVRHLSAALKQKELVEELARERDRLSNLLREEKALSEASRALLTRTANRDVLLNQMIDAVVHDFGHETCSLLLYDADQKMLVQFARRGNWWSEGDPVSVIPLDGSGLIPAAARSGAVLNVPDVARDARYLEGWKEARSELVVPLVLDGEVVGVFDLQSSRLGAYSEANVAMISAFAERAALALRLADLVTRLEQRTQVLEAVTRATQLLNFRLHAPDVVSSVVEETSRAFPRSDGCIVYVADPDGTTLSVAAVFGVGVMTQRGWGPGPIPVARLKCAGRAFLENRPCFLEVSGFDELAQGEPAEARARARAAVENPDLRHLMAAPIRVGSQRLGVVEVLACRPRAFSPVDAETLVLLAEQAAIALRNARLIEELQRSNRLKDDFLANLSHEVRTPLTGIVGWAEVLLDSKGDDPQVRRALEAILSQAEALSRMLADLIDLSRIDNFGLEIRRSRVSLAAVIADALDAVSPGASKHDVAIRCRIDANLPAMEGDPARLKQVVWNLLTNGVKFSPPGSTVDVTARRSPAGGVELIVEDQGVGIDASFLPHVFERFRQEESSSNRRFGGLGIGLSIASAIVEAHGGTISAASPGRARGARFRVQGPPEHASGVEAAGAPSGGEARPGEGGAGR